MDDLVVTCDKIVETTKSAAINPSDLINYWQVAVFLLPITCLPLFDTIVVISCIYCGLLSNCIEVSRAREMNIKIVRSVNSFYLNISNSNGHVEASNGHKYLTLVPTGESRDTLEKYEIKWKKN